MSDRGLWICPEGLNCMLPWCTGHAVLSSRDEVIAQSVTTQPECNGLLAAAWCPLCGDCTCERDEALDKPDCPLHGRESAHADTS